MHRRKRNVLGLVVSLGFVLAACAPSAPGSTTPPTQPAGGASPGKAAATTPSDAKGAESASKAAQQGSALAALIEAANKEGRVNYADTGTPEVWAELNQLFNKRFGTNITVELVPLRATETITRIRQEAAAGKVTLDVVHPSSGLVFGLIDDKVDVLEKFDWLGTLGDTLPGFRGVVERVPEVARGMALEHQHLIRVLVYNKDLVKSDDVPKRWEDLLDPKWKGKKISIDPQGSSTYQLVVKWDEAKVLDYSLKLAAQDPLWVGSSLNVARAVGRGEALVGVTSLTNVKDVLDEGMPVAIAPTEFYPGTQQLMFPVKGSPNINAARLWTAWVVTEGNKLASERGETSEHGWPDSDSWSARQLAALGGELAMLIDQAELQRADDVRTKIVDEYKRLGVEGS